MYLKPKPYAMRFFLKHEHSYNNTCNKAFHQTYNKTRCATNKIFIATNIFIQSIQ